jgi:glutathione S-transferase
MLQLVIGNKNYSSWSMRPWVLLRQIGIPFDEVKLRFDFKDGSAYRQEVARYSPAGLVPLLMHDGFVVWDTLAIAEYMNDALPTAGIWPPDRQQRARARCLAAEMHSGFGALRSHCPMNIEASLPEVGARIWAEQEGVRRNLARLESAWADALAESGGPFLFGRFCAADAFFAPVVMRLQTYALPVSDNTREYMARVAGTHAVKAWVADACAEADFLDFEEPYRQHR